MPPPALAQAARWSRVAFVSDLHLCEAMPRTADAFEATLATLQADALFVLGDLFEVWIGDDTADEPFHRRCLAALAACARSRPVFLMHGNRDFLLGTRACALAGAQLLPDPCPVTLMGEPVLLSHGDALCLDDAPYQAFRAQVRQPVWQAAFLARPLAERAQIARQIRDESQGRKAAQPNLADWADVDAAAARAALQQAGATTLVHGHTHRPGRHDLGDGLQRLVLTDWDLDGAARRGAWLLRDAQGWHREPVPDAA